MSFFKRSLAGPGFIILNTIRVMNIIALLAVIAASWVMLVKTFFISKYVSKRSSVYHLTKYKQVLFL